jgi:hypothetical protein
MGGCPLREWRVGEGVLKMLPAWLCLRFLIWIQQKMTAARISAAPRIDPMTMPAMAPPESPDRDLPAPAATLLVAEGAPDEVLDGNSGGIETVGGSLTPTQRLLTFALTQHEFVELTELSAQYEHSPRRLP